MTGGKIKGESKITMIPVFQISENKSQPRKHYNRSDLKYLAQSIELNGIIQPLIVRDVSNFEYELISGERRLRAAVLAGYSFIPCIVIHCSENQSAVYTLIENIQREDLNFFEQAQALNRLINEYGFTVERISKQTGQSELNVSNKLNLLKFTEQEKSLITDNCLSERYARVLLQINDSNIRLKILKKVTQNKLSYFDTEELVNTLIKPDPEESANSRKKIVIKDIRLFYNTIENTVKRMKEVGIKTTEEKTETDTFVEYRIKIHK